MTTIEWVKNNDGTNGESWNPITGCIPISEGCAHCYAKRMANRLRGRYGYPKDDPFKVTFHPDKLDQPLRWKKPRRIFVCSMSDLFHEDVEWNWQYKIFEMMIIKPDHIYLVLTKRPDRMKKILPDIWFHLNRNYPKIHTPLKNLWLGVTAENQKRADERIPILLQIPAAIRFVSVEPMLGPVGLRLNIRNDLGRWDSNGRELPLKKIDWVICGGESGLGARPMHPDWARSVRNQCIEAGVPFFFKQWGEYVESIPSTFNSANQHTYEHGTSFYRVGKKAAGRLLDGREWNEVPMENKTI